MSAAKRLAALREAATEGLWRQWGMQLRAATCPEQCSKLSHSIVVAGFHTMRDGHPRTFDAALVQALVNATPQLIALIEDAQRRHVRYCRFAHTPPCGCDGPRQCSETNRLVTDCAICTALADLDRALGEPT